MYRIKTQKGELINAFSFHFDGHTRRIYADIKESGQFNPEDCVICGEYCDRARVTKVFRDMTEAFKALGTGTENREGFIYEMPEK